MTDDPKLAEAFDRLDRLAGMLMLKFGTAAAAKMLTILARKYCDLFKNEIERSDLANRKPEGFS